MHLPQVGGELRLLVTAAGNIAVGADDLAPGGQPAGGRALDGRAGALAPLAAHLLVEADAQKFVLHPLHLGRLRRGDGRQQAIGRVEGAIGVVAAERLLVGPFVAEAAQFADQAALGVAQGAVEDGVPLLPHQLQDGRGVEVGQVLVFGPVEIVAPVAGGHADPVFAVDGQHLAVNKGQQPLAQQLHCLADSFVVGDSHNNTLTPQTTAPAPPASAAPGA